MVSFHTIFPSEGASLSSYHGSTIRKMGFLGSPQGRKTLWGKDGTPKRKMAARSVAEGLPDSSGGCARRAMGNQKRCLRKLQAFCKRLDRKLLRFYC